MKYFTYGFSLVSLGVVLAILAGSHLTVCNLCKTEVTAEVQSDELDKVNENNIKKAKLIQFDDKLFIQKSRKYAEINKDFNKVIKQVTSNAKQNSCSTIDSDLNARVLKRLNKTANNYRMAANSLLDADPARVGSR